MLCFTYRQKLMPVSVISSNCERYESPLNPIEPLTAKPVLRWYFRKARWEQFTNLTESGSDSPPNPSSNLETMYSAFCQLLLSSARKSIPRGCRRQYIPPWDSECDQRYNAFLLAKGQSTLRTCQELPDVIFVCFVASGNSALVHGSALPLLSAIKQTKNRARLLLATSQCRLALRVVQIQISRRGSSHPVMRENVDGSSR